MNVLFEEFQLVSITALSAPPRLYEFIYAQYKHALKEALGGVPTEMHETIRLKALALTLALTFTLTSPLPSPISQFLPLMSPLLSLSPSHLPHAPHNLRPWMSCLIAS